MPTLGVLVTNYNTWDFALACVRAHRRLHGDRLARVVLLDDCSPQEAPAGVFEEPGVLVLRNEHNLGFSANLNKGVRAVGTDVVLIFDADALPLGTYFDRIVEAFDADPRLAVLGFRTQDAGGRPTACEHAEPGAMGLVLGPSWLVPWQRVFPERETRRCLPTAAIAVRRAAFDAVGGFDEHLRWLDVDFDFCMKLNRAAPPWTLRVDDALVAQHDYGGTPVSSRARVLQTHAARWYLLRKHGKIAHPRLVKAAVLARLALQWGLLAVWGRRIFPGDPAVRQDKLASRRELLAYCWRHYV